MASQDAEKERRVKNMWLAVFGISIFVCVAGIVYLAHKIKTSGLLDKIESRAVSMSLALLIVLAFVAILCIFFDLTNAIVIVIHVMFFLLAGDLIGFIMRKASITADHRFIDLAALILCVIYFCVGWYLMHGLWQTDYTLETSKHSGNIRIAQIADSHIGSGFTGKEFADKLAPIQACEPDILVITGDFVDDSTSKQDMIDACAAFSQFKTKYGIYYCMGNHDFGYRGGSGRGYTGDELLDELRANGVTVLLDEARLIDDRFYVIGRRDSGYGVSSRLPIGDLIGGLDKDKYMIVLDHQPTDYDAESAAGVDLVLSGHTHGGQLFPLEYIQPLVSENDNVRGHEKRGGTDFIVTDGISDWAVKFRTGCRSEYVIVDVKGK